MGGDGREGRRTPCEETLFGEDGNAIDDKDDDLDEVEEHGWSTWAGVVIYREGVGGCLCAGEGQVIGA